MFHVKQDPSSMYAIGDIQGCLATFEALLEKLDTQEPLVILGDLVNRGPDSLGVLRRIQALGDRVQVLLGNHDIHLLAVYAGARQAHRSDTIEDILNAPDVSALVDWLRHQPLMIETPECYAVHAGVLPSWTPEMAKAESRFVESYLQANDWQETLGSLFGPGQWSPELTGIARAQGAINVLTRCRYLNPDFSMAFKPKLHPKDEDPTLIPWFKALQGKAWDKPLLFGHWSTLGLYHDPHVWGLDTGCLWGGSLTALRLPQGEVIDVKSPGFSTPGTD